MTAFPVETVPEETIPDELGDVKRLRREAGDVIDIVVDGITASNPRAAARRRRLFGEVVLGRNR